MSASGVFMGNRPHGESVQSLRRGAVSLSEALLYSRDSVEKMQGGCKICISSVNVSLNLFAFTDLCDNLARARFIGVSSTAKNCLGDEIKKVCNTILGTK